MLREAKTKKRRKIKMCRTLITHYQLAALTEKQIKNRETCAKYARKRVAIRILDMIYSIDDISRASVLTSHEQSIINQGNALRRLAQKY